MPKIKKSLKEWCEENNRLDLLDEWDYENNGDLTPETISWCSGKHVFWLCNHKHSWKTTVAHRVTDNTRCPYCSNKKVLIGYNDLETWCKQNNKNKLIEEWDTGKNEISINEVSFGSDKKVWWKCKSGHEWKATISSRTKGECGCAVCSQKRLYKGYNDLETYCTTHKDKKHLLDEWDYEENELKPSDVTAHCDKIVHWKCYHGHKWQASIGSRVSGRGCPYCNTQTSFPEQVIFYYVQQAYVDAINRYKTENMEFDIFIPSLNIAIEYDGFAFHQDVQRDIMKAKFCKQKGIKLIRVRENGLPNIPECIIINRIDRRNENDLDNTIYELFSLLNITNIKIDINKDRNNIIKNYKFISKEKSVANLLPELLLDFDPSLNNNLQLENFSKGSHHIMHWKCHKCGYEWDAQIKTRYRGCGCKICGQNKISKIKGNAVICIETNTKYQSITLAEKATGIERHQIANCCKGKQQTAGKYHWEYVDENNKENQDNV